MEISLASSLQSDSKYETMSRLAVEASKGKNNLIPVRKLTGMFDIEKVGMDSEGDIFVHTPDACYSFGKGHSALATALRISAPFQVAKSQGDKAKMDLNWRMRKRLVVDSVGAANFADILKKAVSMSMDWI